jgi:hypothetical protein
VDAEAETRCQQPHASKRRAHHAFEELLCTLHQLPGAVKHGHCPIAGLHLVLLIKPFRYNCECFDPTATKTVEI